MKFYYEIGETVRFTCTGGTKLAGPPLLKCLDSGHWSGACRGVSSYITRHVNSV